MDRRLLGWVGAISAVLLLAGLAGIDRLFAEWLRTSGFEQARVFADGLGALDIATGIRVWFWLAGVIVLIIGIALSFWRPHLRWPRVFVVASLVQFACIATMILGKRHFGRLRPEQVLETGDWSQLWFAGGGSFPSGHSAFYFGLFLPIAAACPALWQRFIVLAIPVYVALARIDIAKHFLSDVAASALIAAIYTLIAATLARRWLHAPRAR